MKPAARLALVAVWCALATGFVELALSVVQTQFLHRSLYHGLTIVWMKPLANVLLFGAVAVVVGLVAIRVPAAAGMRSVATVMCSLAGLTVVFMQPRLYWWANDLLSLGFGVTAGRFAAEHEVRVLRFARRTLPAFAILTLVLGGMVHLGAARNEARALAALPAARPEAPNVLLIIWDTVRETSVSLHGRGRPTTPHLSSFASRGVAFDEAIAPASYTLPTHASIFTGLYPHQLAISWRVPLDAHTPTLAEALAARGYRTAGFSANHTYVTWEQGLDRGFSHFEDYKVSWAELLRSQTLLWVASKNSTIQRLLGRHDEPGRRSAADIRRAFLDWMDEDDSGRPFFAFLNLFDAHRPYLPKPPFDTLFGGPLDTVAASDRALGSQLDLYEGAIAGLDQDLGLLLDDLDRRGVLAHTIVIVTSDHGEAFGEHRTIGHGNDVYQNTVHVPLVVVYPPAVPAGVRISGVVTLRDVPATIAELVQAADDRWPLGGRSLARHWLAQPAVDTVLTEVDSLPRGGPSWYPVRRGDVRSLVAWPFQLIMTGDMPELYDLATDPDQHRDLAGDHAHAATVETLRNALRERRADAVPSKR